MDLDPILALKGFCVLRKCGLKYLRNLETLMPLFSGFSTAPGLAARKQISDFTYLSNDLHSSVNLVLKKYVEDGVTPKDARATLNAIIEEIKALILKVDEEYKKRLGFVDNPPKGEIAREDIALKNDIEAKLRNLKLQKTTGAKISSLFFKNSTQKNRYNVGIKSYKEGLEKEKSELLRKLNEQKEWAEMNKNLLEQSFSYLVTVDPELLTIRNEYMAMGYKYVETAFGKNGSIVPDRLIRGGEVIPLSKWKEELPLAKERAASRTKEMDAIIAREGERKAAEKVAAAGRAAEQMRKDQEDREQMLKAHYAAAATYTEHNKQPYGQYGNPEVAGQERYSPPNNGRYGQFGGVACRTRRGHGKKRRATRSTRAGSSRQHKK